MRWKFMSHVDSPKEDKIEAKERRTRRRKGQKRDSWQLSDIPHPFAFPFCDSREGNSHSVSLDNNVCYSF